MGEGALLHHRSYAPETIQGGRFNGVTTFHSPQSPSVARRAASPRAGSGLSGGQMFLGLGIESPRLSTAACRAMRNHPCKRDYETAIKLQRDLRAPVETVFSKVVYPLDSSTCHPHRSGKHGKYFKFPNLVPSNSSATDLPHLELTIRHQRRRVRGHGRQRLRRHRLRSPPRPPIPDRQQQLPQDLQVLSRSLPGPHGARDRRIHRFRPVQVQSQHVPVT